MREEEIKKAIALLKSEKLASVSQEQRNEFLKGKFSEEEISEIHRRLKENKSAESKLVAAPAGSNAPSQILGKEPTAAPIIYNSPQGQ